MFETISFIVGGAFRLAPELFKLFDAANQRKHEREMLELQIKADELRAQAEVQKAEVQGEIQQQLAEIQAMIEALKAQGSATVQRTGIKWLDGFVALLEAANISVRPVLTYWYCVAAYGAYKVASYYMILSTGASWANAVTVLWTPQDQSVMFSIIGFWFVDRAIRKQRS